MKTSDKITTVTFRTHALTNSQRLIWMGQRLTPDRPIYNMALAFEISGPIDVERFQHAFRLLIDQCDAMRTVFVLENDEPKQRILDTFAYSLEVIDWSDSTPEAASIKKWLQDRSQQLFDLSVRLFDSVLIRLSRDRYLWYFNQHHLITDAWGVSVQYQAMSELYRSIHEEHKELTLSLPSFESYIISSIHRTEDPQYRRAVAYWAEKQKELPGPPEFFGRRVWRPDTSSRRISLPLGRERSEALRGLARQAELRAWTEHLSLFQIFSTLLFAYLYRISGQLHLSLGTPAHNRTSSREKQTPGLFIELFPISITLSPQDSFIELFNKVRDDVHQFLKHAQPGSSTAELSRGYQVVLNYITATFSDFAGTAMQSTWIHPKHADPSHYLRLQVHDFADDGKINLYFDLNTQVFDTAQQERIPQQFLRLLDSFLADPRQPVGHPALLPDDGAIAGSLHAGSGPLPSVLDSLAQQARLKPDAVAIQFEGETLTYAQLQEQTSQLAHYLIDNGVQTGDRVAVFTRRTPAFLISIWAVLKAGAAFVPIPTHYPSGRVLGIIEDAKARLVISDSSRAEVLNVIPAAILRLDREQAFIAQQKTSDAEVDLSPGSTAYLMYTSGSTGNPKGVMISHRALAHYIDWARHTYIEDETPVMPLFTSTGFDLTITSAFLPLVAGGSVVPYPEDEQPPDLSLLRVIEEDIVNIIKLTPSHLALLNGRDDGPSRVRTLIVGGENLSTATANAAWQYFGEPAIYNEYGPTEATVGCVVHRYDPEKDQQTSVPIGKPINGTTVYVLDEFDHPVPDGIPGELHISGPTLADGYWQQQGLTEEKFLNYILRPEIRMYRSGDLVRMNQKGQLEYLGRKDEQVKIGGRRVEPEEVATVMMQYPGIRHAVVVSQERVKARPVPAQHNCTQCGLPSNYPDAKFNEQGVCHLCLSFESYQEKVSRYFRNMDDLRKLFADSQQEGGRAYDCIMLLSGGKDSTYALARLAEMGLRVLAFTLDNGYISDQAKDNIRRVVDELGVDHVFGQTPAMNAIFVDSLQRHSNVCDGCFKTIYTLAVQLAVEKDIPYIVTGLSRGQFFETRLTEELFRKDDFNPDQIDDLILEARKAYHRVDDAVRRLLDVSMFENEDLFDTVQFVDFYRYCDVSLEDMLAYLDDRLPWVRPTDTGRSTNCLINQAGIYVHKQDTGYSNYAFPYSWDVRVGHKTREASLEEINERIDEQEVRRILDEIGYTRAQQDRQKTERLIAYYTADAAVPTQALRHHLLGRFPEFMVPAQFIHLEELPMTMNGKIDYQALPTPDSGRPDLGIDYVAPRTDIEEMIADIWSDLLHIDRVGVLDHFIEVGGDSLTGIRVMARINEVFELELPINLIFEKTNIAAMAVHIEETIKKLLAELERSEQN